jgi:cysteine protease ATG4
LFKNHKTIFSIVDEPPSWSDVDDSLESMSEPEEEEDEEEDMPEDKDSSRPGVGKEEEEERHGDEEEDSDVSSMQARALPSTTESHRARHLKADKARPIPKMIPLDL